jgi:hypothetical protein
MEQALRAHRVADQLWMTTNTVIRLWIQRQAQPSWCCRMVRQPA